MKFLSYIGFLFFGVGSFAQEAGIKLKTNQLRIGEQTTLNIWFKYKNPDGKASITWPVYDDFLTEGVEIIEKTIDQEYLIDSLSSTYYREQNLLLTIFDEGTYQIPAQEIGLNDSSYYSNTEEILVETVQVDTSKGITDLKPIHEVNYPFSQRSKDWFLENWYWVVLLLLSLISYFGWRYYIRKNAEKAPVKKEVIAAHILALTALEELLTNENWKSSEKKKYYSNLTGIVRTYLENRFSIHALEKTTREIIFDLKNASISEDDKQYLRKILQEADMVKFAKFSPNNDNALELLNKSIDFVNRTQEKKGMNEN